MHYERLDQLVKDLKANERHGEMLHDRGVELAFDGTLGWVECSIGRSRCGRL